MGYEIPSTTLKTLMNTISKYETRKNLSLNRFFLIVVALIMAGFQLPLVMHELAKIIPIHFAG